jgi:alkaline phosphatase D
MVWDDHEVENDYANDRGSTLLGATFLRLRAAAHQAYWEHQPLPKAMRPAGPDMRIHERYDWGRLARIHTVDDRQFRDHQTCAPMLRSFGSSTVAAPGCPELRDPRRSLLGAARERRLGAACPASWCSVATCTAPTSPT